MQISINDNIYIAKLFIYIIYKICKYIYLKQGKLYGVYICKDRWERPVLLFRNPWKVTQLAGEAEYLSLEPWAMPPTEFV